MNAKAPTFVVEYENNSHSDKQDDRLRSPAFEKNHVVIRNVITQLLDSRTGNVIEIGSGTGQHVVEYARALPELTWWPSDLRPTHLKSIEAWREYSGQKNLMAPVLIDAAQSDWKLGHPIMLPENNITAIVASNLLHVAPWNVAEGLITAAGRYLYQDGFLAIYGAFSRGGRHVSENNAAFDVSLRERDPEFGVRDTVEIQKVATNNGLNLSQIIDMPSNNFMLVMTRQ